MTKLENRQLIVETQLIPYLKKTEGKIKEIDTWMKTSICVWKNFRIFTFLQTLIKGLIKNS